MSCLLCYLYVKSYTISQLDINTIPEIGNQRLLMSTLSYSVDPLMMGPSAKQGDKPKPPGSEGGSMPNNKDQKMKKVVKQILKIMKDIMMSGQKGQQPPGSEGTTKKPDKMKKVIKQILLMFKHIMMSKPKGDF